MNNTGNGKDVKRSSETWFSSFQTTLGGFWVTSTACVVL